MITTSEIWVVIVGLGLGSFLLRFSFTGMVGARNLPAWVLRHLRYTAVALLPGLVAPLVVWPAATGGSPDGPRMIAAAATILVGLVTRNVLAAIVAGATGLYLSLYLLG
ncbi:AzlD domain-containing protein [Marinovum sp.]|uniref:AzlD domain-containing protein n=1 Tax=Marinovum sp. TaxID=2024839 RepID=UPI002B2703CA|nr:AzlD domain-containing protein [Marinovum sp.]